MFSNKDYILTVYKHKSFSKAAKELYISQPSLSASVKRIEAEVGAPIFDRSTNPLSLTEIGEKYIQYALEISAIESNFKSFVNDSSDMVAGTIKIGGSSMFSSFVLAPLISDFNRLFPKIKFQIVEDSTQRLNELLMEGKIDIMVDNVLIQNKSVEPSVLMPEVLMLAVPASLEINKKLKENSFSSADISAGKHNLPDAPTVSLSDFKNENFLLLKSENDTGKRALKLFKKHNISPKVIFKLDQQMTAFNITCSGLGISFISDTLIAHNSTPDVCYYKLNDESIVRNIYFYVKANRYISNACKKFMEISAKG